MPINIIVCVKQVVDPETPASAFKVDREAKRVVPASGVPPVVNGFDENAVELALRLRDAHGGKVTALSLGTDFVMDVMKKPLSMGADDLVLLRDSSFSNIDSFGTAVALAAAIRKIGNYDLILCGRQASDWDNAQVPLGLAELLGLPSITTAKSIQVRDKTLIVERALPDGYDVFETPFPAVVTVSNEAGQPRYPTLRGIMMASRKTPITWGLSDLGLDASAIASKLSLLDLFIPVTQKQCEFIEGENDADAGRKLALKLREAKLI
ncbi:MAG: electron transfer flavoprotein subunit beta/FixA family protein [Chloroflexi bacterium]|nr:electron transfer flavoprotein subunit beta/FixA family protein [Chloroflexota bacterium]